MLIKCPSAYGLGMELKQILRSKLLIQILTRQRVMILPEAILSYLSWQQQRQLYVYPDNTIIKFGESGLVKDDHTTT